MPSKVVTYPEDSKPDLATLLQLNSLYSLFQYEPIILYRVDSQISDIVAKHVSQIFLRGYAEHLDAYDFFHGHFFVNSNCIERDDDIFILEKGKESKYRAKMRYLNKPSAMVKGEWVKLFLDSEPHFVYHTREHSSRKTNSDRSIIGDGLGNIYVMKGFDKAFLERGTVFAWQPFSYDNKPVTGMGLIPPGVHLPTEDFPKATINTGQFYVLRDSFGRYQTPCGERFDAYYELWNEQAK